MTNDFSEAWYRVFSDTKTKAESVNEIEFVRQFLPLPENREILDLGCGGGRHSRELAKSGYNVLGLDKSQSSIERAKRACSEYSNTKFRMLDMRQLTLLNCCYDGCISLWHSFGYFDSETNLKVLCDISSILKPAGRLIIDLYNREFFLKAPLKEEFTIGENQIISHNSWDGDRYRVELSYGDEDLRDTFDWCLYDPCQFAEMAERAGFAIIARASRFDVKGNPSASDARMQFVLEKCLDYTAASR